jgi:hypothetical protein
MGFAIIGCGGIGSNVANLLARLGGQRFTLFDPDDVAEPNIAPGWFTLDSLRADEDAPEMTKKVRVIQTQLHQGFGVELDNIQIYSERYQSQPVEGVDVVFSATDSMQARRQTWRSRARFGDWRLWVDARMGGDQCSLYVALNPLLPAMLEAEQRDAFIRTSMDYFSNYEASLDLPNTALPCGLKATASLTTGMIPGMVGSVLYRFVNGQLPPKHLFYQMGTSWWTCVESIR